MNNNTELSEKYRKYLVHFTINQGEFYSVWGFDAADGNDKLLIMEDKLILFEELHMMKSFLLTSNIKLFDELNFKTWLNQIDIDAIEPYTTYDIDRIVTSLKDKEFSKEKVLELLGLIHIISDFALQTINRPILTILNRESISIFKEKAYNKHIWINNILQPSIQPNKWLINSVELLTNKFQQSLVIM